MIPLADSLAILCQLFRQTIDLPNESRLAKGNKTDAGQITMGVIKLGRFAIAFLGVAAIAGCGASGGNAPANQSAAAGDFVREDAQATSSIWELFNTGNQETVVSVNRYIWAASLEVLDFLPVQSVDPFTGVIVTGYGTPPGGGRSYRATVLIDDPALDARSLNLSLQTRGGRAVSRATARAVEDAILSRARELRIRDNKF